MPDVTVRCVNAECTENAVLKSGTVSDADAPIYCGTCSEPCEPVPEPEPRA